MPDDLKACYFVNSGSEANDLALLMARAYTQNYDLIALRNAYHGGNASGMGVTAHSTWKYNVPHSFGVHHALAPYQYRGVFGYDEDVYKRQGTISEICSPDKGRWGVYQIWFPKVIKTKDDLIFNFQTVLPQLKEIYERIKKQK